MDGSFGTMHTHRIFAVVVGVAVAGASLVVVCAGQLPLDPFRETGQSVVNYVYADDVAPILPKGTVIKVTGWHDNTAANRNNPDPAQWVGYGDRIVDEMGFAWVDVTYLEQEDYERLSAERAKRGSNNE